MFTRIAKIAAISVLALGTAATTADASCHSRKTTGTVVGAGTGGLLGAAITHGSPVGIVGGAVVGGLAGHSIGASGCRSHYYRHHRRGYYDSRHHWHYYRD